MRKLYSHVDSRKIQETIALAEPMSTSLKEHFVPQVYVQLNRVEVTFGGNDYVTIAIISLL